MLFNCTNCTNIFLLGAYAKITAKTNHIWCMLNQPAKKIWSIWYDVSKSSWTFVCYRLYSRGKGFKDVSLLPWSLGKGGKGFNLSKTFQTDFRKDKEKTPYVDFSTKSMVSIPWSDIGRRLWSLSNVWDKWPLWRVMVSTMLRPWIRRGIVVCDCMVSCHISLEMKYRCIEWL